MSIHMKKGKKRTEGFTLVELICVIAILGILVAIAVQCPPTGESRTNQRSR